MGAQLAPIQAGIFAYLGQSPAPREVRRCAGCWRSTEKASGSSSAAHRRLKLDHR